jgi:hypothetical protein
VQTTPRSFVISCPDIRTAEATHPDDRIRNLDIAQPSDYALPDASNAKIAKAKINENGHREAHARTRAIGMWRDVRCEGQEGMECVALCVVQCAGNLHLKSTKAMGGPAHAPTPQR